MAQTWRDLLFAHWPLEPNVLRPLVPRELPLDTFDGECWVGIAPFWMSHIHGRGLPPLPGLSRFPELNVRTYVVRNGKPGVYFFSLDAANRIAVWAARTFFRLPYFHARMNCKPGKGEILYKSSRQGGPAEFRARYRPVGPIELRQPGSLAHWLTERYCLYTVSEGCSYRAEIHHEPWPLQDAEAEIEFNSMASAAGIDLPRTLPLLHFAKQLEVIVWPLRKV
jgi:uncharacterized protein YqjF (DUF2071 family)